VKSPVWFLLAVACCVVVGGFLMTEPKSALTWAWLFWALAFFAIEAYALYNGTPGDTLSGYVWRWARGAWWRKGTLVVVLLWLIYHFVFQPLMPS
jgi:hypothetical protein